MGLPQPAPERASARTVASLRAVDAAPVDPPMVTAPLKRLLDVVGAAVLLVLAAPLGLLIALAIRLDSPGEILLRQERCGYRGRRFTCLKFRSMRENADPEPHRAYVRELMSAGGGHANGGVFKLVNDQRVTRVGAFLRRTSLDELPQLWNVLAGEMSLVGPRPPLPYEVELYDERQHGRLACKPGLTGLWQVSGRNQVSYRDMCEIDLDYIRDWSLWLDISILLRTPQVVLLNSGRAG